MNRIAAAFTGAPLAAGVGQSTSGAPRISITGRLIDLGNYAAGHPHSEYSGIRARACALEGFEVGLLSDDGKVYHVAGELAANVNAKLVPHMLAETVTITGEVSVKDGQTIIEGSNLEEVDKQG
jgi:hypothetical protein